MAMMSDVDLQILGKLIAESTAARGVDQYAVEVMGLEPVEWAEMTDRDRSTVARNIRRARDTLDGDD